MTEKCYSVCEEIKVPAMQAYEYLLEPFNLGKWALGCWETKATDTEGLYCGESLFDRETLFFKIVQLGSPLIVDFHVGTESQLLPRISARIVPGADYNAEDEVCLLTLTAWRDRNMNDERWHQLRSCHDTEIILLKALIENSSS